MLRTINYFNSINLQRFLISSFHSNVVSEEITKDAREWRKNENVHLSIFRHAHSKTISIETEQIFYYHIIQKPNNIFSWESVAL